MAANNALILKLKKLFATENFLDTTKGLLLGKTMMQFLDPAVVAPTDPSALFNAIDQRFDVLLANNQITDANFVQFFLTMSKDDIQAMGPDLVAEIMENPQYQNINPKVRKTFEQQIDFAFGFKDVQFKAMENINAVVLNEENLRRMVTASVSSVKDKKAAMDSINQTITTFDQKYKDVDVVRLCAGPRYYENTFTPQKNLMGQLRAGYNLILNPQESAFVSNCNEDLVNMQKTQGEKNAYLISQVAVYDETVEAILKRKGVDADKHPEAFLGNKIEANTKENQRFFPKLLKTFGMATGVSFAVNVLSHVPVVGQYVGGVMAVSTLVKKSYNEYQKAKQVASAQNRKLDRRDAAKIAINAASSAAPYAAMMAFGPLGRHISSAGMALKSFFTDINHKKARLKENEKLNAKDYLASIGKAVATGGAMWLGGKLGSMMGEGLVAGIQAEALAAHENVVEQDHQQVNHETNTENTAENVNDAKLTTNKITADENSLKALRNHKFDLTDNARATANPDNDRMWQNGEQSDWYNKAEYDQAIETLRQAGVQDADGALRNLAGAKMFKGGEFDTELNNLLHGKLTTNTINKILEADQMLDETADLIGGAENIVDSSNQIVNHEVIEPRNETNVQSAKPTLSNDQQRVDADGNLLPDHDFGTGETLNQENSDLLPEHDFGISQNATTSTIMPEHQFNNAVETESSHALPNHSWADSYESAFNHVANNVNINENGNEIVNINGQSLVLDNMDPIEREMAINFANGNADSHLDVIHSQFNEASAQFNQDQIAQDIVNNQFDDSVMEQHIAQSGETNVNQAIDNVANYYDKAYDYQNAQTAYDDMQSHFENVHNDQMNQAEEMYQPDLESIKPAEPTDPFKRTNDLVSEIQRVTGQTDIKGRVIGGRTFIDSATGQKYDLFTSNETTSSSSLPSHDFDREM